MIVLWLGSQEEQVTHSNYFYLGSCWNDFFTENLIKYAIKITDICSILHAKISPLLENLRFHARPIRDHGPKVEWDIELFHLPAFLSVILMSISYTEPLTLLHNAQLAFWGAGRLTELPNCGSMTFLGTFILYWAFAKDD